MILWISKILLPFVISYVVAFGLISHRPVFDDFLDGAKSGMKTVAEILPTLVGAGLGNLVYDVHAVNDHTECCVSAV